MQDFGKIQSQSLDFIVGEKQAALIAISSVVIAICQIPAGFVSTSQLFCIYGHDDWDGTYKLENHAERVNWCSGSSPAQVKAPGQ